MLPVKKSVYSFTPNELKTFISDFLFEKYEVRTKVKGQFDSESTYPIHMYVTGDDSDEYWEMWDKVQREIMRIETEREHENAHHLLQWIFGKPISKYVFDKNETKHLEYIKGDQANVYIIFDEENPLKYVSEDEYAKLIEEYEEETVFMAPNVTKDVFLPLESDSTRLSYFLNSVNVLFIDFLYKENAPFKIQVHLSDLKDKKATVTFSSYLVSEEMAEEATRIMYYILPILKEQFSFAGDVDLVIEDKTIAVMEEIIFYEGLTEAESVIFSLIKTKTWDEIAELLNTRKKWVDNTLQRIKGKVRRSFDPDEEVHIDKRIVEFYSVKN